jgi:GT2 family glycosyltransferase
MKPRISVIIPTYNRCARLLQTLASLTRQDSAPRLFEVIVVADGCLDDTARRVKDLDVPYALTLLEQAELGAAAARNCGASAAAAPLLLFLDDDMMASPGLVTAHLAAHEANSDSVVLGYFPMPPSTGRADPFHVALKLWWDRRFAELAQPAHRYSFWDLCAGNFSLSQRLLGAVGGFDPGFQRASGEDYDLGMRLLRHGAHFYFSREAFSTHHATASPAKALRRSRQDGYSQVLLAQKYPELFGVLRLRRLSEFSARPLNRPLWRIAWCLPVLADMAAWMLHRTFSICAAVRLIDIAWRIFDGLDGYNFWRGVMAAVGSREGWERLKRSAEEPAAMHEIEIDLATDVERLDAILNQARPDAVLLRFHERPLGRIPPVAGAEPIRAVHVREALVHHHALPLLGLLVLDSFRAPAQPPGLSLSVTARSENALPRGEPPRLP